MKTKIRILQDKLAILKAALSTRRSEQYCLKLWSEFIRLRDGHCIACGTKKFLAAHHIFRKSFLIGARFDTGNGISLCKSCHEEPHESFNRKANLGLPMDAEDGEKIELALAFLTYLIEDAKKQKLLRDDFYYFSDQALITFKKFQTIDADLKFPGLRIEQAQLIWDQTPRCMMEAILNANGFDLPKDFIQRRSGILFFIE